MDAADGSNVTQLTNSSGDNRDPVWSPDGTRIAFMSFRDGDWEIYVMNADGSGQNNISNDPGTDQHPAWSPDGTKIAFCSLRGGDLDLELYTMDADGSNQTALTADGVHDISPWWSPDGTLILLSTFGTGNDEVYTRNATDGSGLNNLSQSAGVDGKAVWSWSAPANYRPIGTQTADLHSGGTATISPGSVTVTFSGTTLPANVGVGDRIDIPGWTVIKQEQSVTGSGSSSPLAGPVIPGGTDQTYVLLVATNNNADVTGVTGGAGLTWTGQVEQCSGNGGRRMEIWTASGSPGGSFTPTITFTPDDTVVVVLLRYSGVGTLEAASGQNTNGPGGACTGGTNDTTALLTLTSTVSNSIHLIGVNPESNNLSNPTATYVLVDEGSGGSGSNKQDLSVYGRTLSSAGADPFQVSISNPGQDWSTAGIVLNPQSGAETFFIKSRDSDIQVKTDSMASLDHTNETYTIKRAYNTFQAWEDDRDGDLVGEGRREVGVAHDDWDFNPISTIVIDATATDSDHYMKITVAEGQRHAGKPGDGVLIDALGGDFDIFNVLDPYVQIEWLQITNFTGDVNAEAITVAPSAANTLLQHLLVYDYGPGNGVTTRADTTVRNSIFYGGGIGVQVWSESSVTVENVTIYGMSRYGILEHDFSLDNAISIKNTISVGNTLYDFRLMYDITYFGNNMFATVSDFDPGAYQGSNRTPPTDLDDLFVSVTPISEDLHIEATGHSAGNAGLDLSADFVDDIDGVVRTGTWDIGADEGVPGTTPPKPKIIRWTEVDPFQP